MDLTLEDRSERAARLRPALSLARSGITTAVPA